MGRTVSPSLIRPETMTYRTAARTAGTATNRTTTITMMMAILDVSDRGGGG